MKNIVKIIIALCISLAHFTINAQIPAAERPDAYIEMLKGKKLGLTANHTSLTGNKHLLDFLFENGIDVRCVYAPEHGFRGIAQAGEIINNSIDSATGVPIISLYGKNKKPSAEQLKLINCMLFDVQDVGVRFYTYLSTMHYVMEACAENNIALIILDRPNPNGFYVDGPVLESTQKSFVGMHPIPIVHGMTLGELAQMINGERWLANKQECNLTVIPCSDYNHKSRYQLPVKPSPNLPDMQAIYLYPSLCLFEGTALSVGRGTEFPFHVFGHPCYKGKKTYEFEFTPLSNKKGAKVLLEGQKCYGINCAGINNKQLGLDTALQLDWIIEAYKNFEAKDKFFNAFFYKLSGNTSLRQQIEEGKTACEIRESWQNELDKFKLVRKKYLIYDE
jgi:uncharacterized protein YbbC (DUF1343 family)